MSEISAGVTVPFEAIQLDEPFQLAVDDDQGAPSPCRVDYDGRPWVSFGWSMAGEPQKETLTVLSLGRKRVKVYCSEATASTIRLSVDGGDFGKGYAKLGRREDSVIESLTWRRETRKRLRYAYDRPVPEIIQQTHRFFLADGTEVDPPRFDPEFGEFFAPQPLIGAQVVKYQAGFSLFEITYDNGENVSSAELFRQMRRAWEGGDVEMAEVPPVRVVAMSTWHADQIAFPRKFWPQGRPNYSIKVRASEDGSEDDDRLIDSFTESVGTRQTNLARINDPNSGSWVDVEKTIYFEARDVNTGKILRLRMLD